MNYPAPLEWGSSSVQLKSAVVKRQKKDHRLIGGLFCKYFYLELVFAYAV